MGTLYLVRHGQASFGAADYDQLSPLGERQCRRLGEYLKASGQRFDAVITGTLKRQVQSYDALAEGLGQRIEPLALPTLNEYDSHAVLATVHPEPLAKPDTPERYRAHFKLLRDGLTRWMAGSVAPVGMPSYAAFAAGVQDVLDRVRREHAGGQVLVVSSGGPISTAVGLVLGTPPEVGIELNLRLRNSALCEFASSPKRHALVTFNALPHLDSPAYAHWVTHT